MNKQLTIAVLLVLLLSIGAWLYLGTQMEVSLDGEIIHQDGDTQRVEPTRQELEPSASKETTTEVDHAERVGPVKSDEPDLASQLNATNSILIRVVDAETGKGVADSDVSMILSDRSKQAAWLVKMQSDMLGFFRDHGEHYRTSATGEVRLPNEHAILAISSYTDSLFGSVQIPSPLPEQLTIELRPIILTRVRVVDENKKPVALSEVALGVRRDSGRTMEMMTKKTDEDGLAALSFPQDLLIKLAAEGNLYVGLRGVFSPPIDATLDVADLPQEVIELTLPKTSSLAIKVLNAAGAICQEPMSITVSFVDAPKQDRGGRIVPAYQAIAAKGEAVISQVACRANLRLRVEPVGGASFASLEKTIISSDVPGQTREVVFQIEAKFPEMTGRLVDESGQPLAKQSVYFRWGNQVPGKRFKMRGWTIRTDAKGKFKVLLKDQFLETASERFLEFTIKDDFDSTLMIATTILPLAGGDVFSQDVGDVVMIGLPILLSGRATGGHGEPIRGALVSLHRLKEVSERLRQRLPNRIFVGARIGSSKTDKKGNFAIRGQSDLSSFVLRARKSGLLSARQMVAANSENVVIKLLKPGSVKGRIVLPAAVADERVSIVVESLKTGDSWRGQPDEDGAFKTDELRAGGYQFYCFLRPAGERKLHWIRSFSVESGKDTDLGEIRLLENAKSVELNLVEPSELGARGFLSGIILDASSHVEMGAIGMVQPNQTFLMPATPFDLFVYLPGFREAIYRNVQPGRLDVKLKKGFPLRIVVENLELVSPGVVLRLALRSILRSHFVGWQELEAGEGSTTARVPQSGTYRIFATLKRKGFLTVGVELSVPTIEAEGSDAIQEVRLRLDPDSVKEAEEKWR